MRLFAAFLLLAAVSGCAGIRQLAALRHVEFRFDRITDPRVAGISLSGVRSPEDVSASEWAGLALAVASENVPLDLTVHVIGENPEANTITAKLVALDWSYLVDGREAVAGTVTEAYEFPPGQETDMGLSVSLNLVDLFGDRGAALLNSALALAGRREGAHDVTMQLRPTIDTPAGPMRYPAPIELRLASAAK